MWNPLNAPFPYYADAGQGGTDHSYVGSDNQSALMWAITRAIEDTSREPFIMPPGLAMSGPLNAQNAHEVRFINEQGGVLIPNAACAGQSLFDIRGSGAVTLDHMSFGRAAFNPAHKPHSIIRYGIGAASGNVAKLIGVSAFGMTTHGTFFNDAGVSSYIDGGAYYTFGTGPAISMKRATGWHLRTVEIHDCNVQWRQTTRLPGAPIYQGYSDAIPLVLEDCEETLIEGGNIGGNSPRAIDLHGTTRRLTIDTVQAYAQDPAPMLPDGSVGPGLPFNGFLRNTSYVDGLTVRNSRIDAASYVYGGGAGTVWKHIRHEGPVGPFTPANMVSTDGATNWAHVDMDCSGLAFNIRGDLGGVVDGDFLRNVGSINAIKRRLQWSTPDGRWHIDQPMLVG